MAFAFPGWTFRMTATTERSAEKAVWFTPASLEAVTSVDLLLYYQAPVSHNRFPHTSSERPDRSLSATCQPTMRRAHKSMTNAV